MDRATTAAVVAEGSGALLFFFVGAGAIISGADLVGVAFAHGLALAVLVSSLGPVSGGHFNPAVTFAVWIAGRIPTNRAVLYVIAQLVGGLIAGLLLRFVVFPEAQWSPSGLGTPARAQGVSIVTGIVVEAVLTMVLVFAVFGTAIDPRAPKIGGLAIGLAIAADILMGGPITGAAMNPARWFGTAAAAGKLGDFLVYIIGPIAGAAIAAGLWRYVFLEEAEPARTPATPA
jgi:aquaporin Z